MNTALFKRAAWVGGSITVVGGGLIASHLLFPSPIAPPTSTSSATPSYAASPASPADWQTKKIEKDVVLTWDLVGGPSALPPSSFPLTPLHGDLHALNLARNDKRVKGIVANFTDAQLTYSQAEEIGNHLRTFTKSKEKFSMCFAEDFTTEGYMAAVNFEQVFMGPLGKVSFTPPHKTFLFWKDFLAKYGVEVENVYSPPLSVSSMNSQLTPEQHACEQKIQKSLYDFFSENTLRMRRALKGDNAILGLFDQGVFSGKEAQEKGLIDKLLYPFKTSSKTSPSVYNEMQRALAQKKGMEVKDVQTLTMTEYLILRSLEIYNNKCDVPLVVCASLSGGENKSYLLSLMQFLKSNLESNMCGAVVLHIDSQVDCSPQTANMIARAITDYQIEHKKPIYVSLGGDCEGASYVIASAAAAVYVNNSTQIGISSPTSKHTFNYQKLFEHLKIREESVTGGDKKMAPYRTLEALPAMKRFFSKNHQELVNEMLLNRAKLDSDIFIQGGRLSGKDAHTAGLADSTKGLEGAQEAAMDKMMNSIYGGEGQVDLKKHEILESVENFSYAFPVSMISSSCPDALPRNTQPSDWLYHSTHQVGKEEGKEERAKERGGGRNLMGVMGELVKEWGKKM